jgi:competence protein ComEA
VGLRILALMGLALGLRAQDLPDNPGKDLVEAVCTVCHTPERIVVKQMSKEDWQAKVLEMLQEDPDITQPERDRIVEYLARSFPLLRINVNRAAAKEFEAALDLSARDAESIVRYREANGNFKSLEDLKKVPGVDAAKIEARKDRLDF